MTWWAYFKSNETIKGFILLTWTSFGTITELFQYRQTIA